MSEVKKDPITNLYSFFKENDLIGVDMDEPGFKSWLEGGDNATYDAWRILDNNGFNQYTYDEFYSNLWGDPQKKKNIQSGNGSSSSSQESVPAAEKGSDSKDPFVKDSLLATEGEGVVSEKDLPKAESLPEDTEIVDEAVGGRYGFYWSDRDSIPDPEELDVPGSMGTTQDESVDRKNRVRTYTFSPTELALKNLEQNRKGDFESSALEIAERNDPNKEYTEDRNARLTPLELLLGETEGSTINQFKYNLQTLQSENRLITEAIPAIDAKIKMKYGSDVFEKLEGMVDNLNKLGKEFKDEQDEDQKQVLYGNYKQLMETYNYIAGDELFDKRQKMYTLADKNLGTAKGILKSPEFQDARKRVDLANVAQRESDRKAVDGNFVEDVVRSTPEILAKSFYKLVGFAGVASDFIEHKTTGDNKYTLTDKAQDFLIDLADDANSMITTPSQWARPLATTTAKWHRDGEILEVDFEGGEIQSVRDEEGRVVDMMWSESSINEAKSLPRSRQINWKGLPYQTTQAITDFGLQTVGTGGIFNAMKVGKLGKAISSSAGAKKAAAYSSVTLATVGMMAHDSYNHGLELFDGDREKALDYAMTVSATIGLASNLFGLESFLATGTHGLLGSAVKSMSSTMKGITAKGAAKQTAAHVLAQGVGEGLEEGVIEQAIDIGIQHLMQADKPDEATINSAISEGVPGTIVGMVFGGAGAKSYYNDIRNSAVREAAKNPDAFAAELENQIKQGTIKVKDVKTPEEIAAFVEKEKTKLGEIGKALGIIPENMPEEKKLEAVGRISKIQDLKEQKEQAKETGVKALENKVDKEIEKENEELSALFDEVVNSIEQTEPATEAEELIDESIQAQDGEVAEVDPRTSLLMGVKPGKVKNKDSMSITETLLESAKLEQETEGMLMSKKVEESDRLSLETDELIGEDEVNDQQESPEPDNISQAEPDNISQQAIEAEKNRQELLSPQSGSVIGGVEVLAADENTVTVKHGDEEVKLTREEYSQRVNEYFDNMANSKDPLLNAMAKRVAADNAVKGGESDNAVAPPTIITSANVGSIQTEGLSPGVSRAVETLQSIISATSKIIPNMKVVIHTSDAALNEAAKQVGEVAEGSTVKGFYVGDQLHLSQESLDETTLLHEAIQPILTDKLSDKETVTKLYEELKQTKAYEQIQEFEKQYQGDEQQIEALTEYMARVASGKIKPEANTIQKIKNWVSNLLESLGIKNINLDNPNSLADLTATVSRALTKGRKIRGGEIDTSKGFRLANTAEEKARSFVNDYHNARDRSDLVDIVSRGYGIEPEQVEVMIDAAKVRSEVTQTGRSKRAILRAIRAALGTISSEETARSYTDKLDTIHKTYIKANGLLPDSIRIFYEQMQGNINVEVSKAVNSGKRLNELLSPKRSIRDRLMGRDRQEVLELDVRTVDEILRGKARVNIPQGGINGLLSESQGNDMEMVLSDGTIHTISGDIYDAAISFRGHISGLSEALVTNGYVGGVNAEKIGANIWEYVNRSYKIWNDPDYTIEKVDANVREAAERVLAFQHFKDLYYDAFQERWTPAALTTDHPDLYSEAVRLANQDIKDLFQRKKDKVRLGILGGKGATNVGRNMDIFKRRLGEDELPKEIRDLMGEVTDPVQNYVNTVKKLALHKARAEFLTKFREIGYGKFVFGKKDDRDGFHSKIAADGTQSKNPLNGMYTSDEIKEGLESAMSITERAMMDWMPDAAIYARFVAATNWAATIGSYVTHARNVFGNFWFMAHNGYIDLNTVNHFGDAMRAIVNGKSRFGIPENKSDRDKYIEGVLDTLKRHNILDQNTEMSAVKDMFDDDFMSDAMRERVAGEKVSLGKKISGEVGNIVLLKWNDTRVGRKISTWYQNQDNFFKVLSFMAESDRYSKAMYGGKTYSELSTEERIEVDSIVAPIISDILPNYDKIGKAFKAAGRSLVFSNFLSFRVEAVRTAFNSMNLARREASSTNPEIRKIGRKRMVGTAAAFALRYVLTNAWLKYVGMGLHGIGGLFDDEDESVRQDAFRESTMPWSDMNMLLPTHFGDGYCRYIDMGSTDFMSWAIRPVNAVTLAISDPDNETWAEALATGGWGVFNEASEMFLSEKISTNAILNLRSNTDNYGDAIYNPQEGAFKRASDKALYLLKQTVLPRSIHQVEKLMDAYKEGLLKERAGGQFTGFVTYNIDLKRQFGYTLGDYYGPDDSPLEQSKDIYWSQYGKDYVSDEQLWGKYLEANAAYRRNLDKVAESIRNAVAGGVDMKDIREMMKRKRVSKKDMMYIRSSILDKPLNDMFMFDSKIKGRQKMFDSRGK